VHPAPCTMHDRMLIALLVDEGLVTVETLLEVVLVFGLVLIAMFFGWLRWRQNHRGTEPAPFQPPFMSDPD
jgi:hypothetical protein